MRQIEDEFQNQGIQEFICKKTNVIKTNRVT